MMNYLTSSTVNRPSLCLKLTSRWKNWLTKLMERKEAEKALTPFIDRVKALLGERVKDVRLTHRLTDTPAMVSTSADKSTQMAKLSLRRARKCRSEIHLRTEPGSRTGETCGGY
ncbi:hypothetical protein ACNKHM_04620 [Shigella sonnei]